MGIGVYQVWVVERLLQVGLLKDLDWALLAAGIIAASKWQLLRKIVDAGYPNANSSV